MYNRDMLEIPMILRARRRRHRLGSFGRRSHLLGKVASLGVGLLLLSGILLIVGVYSNLWNDLPSIEYLRVLLALPDGQLLQPTTLYDRTGKQVIAVLEDPAAQGRQYLKLEGDSTGSLPQALVDATLVTADPEFWQHPGYILTDLEADSHPTLAQKLVFELLLTEEPASLRRSLREHLLDKFAAA